MKNCPYCGESIQDEAKKCKYCGEWLQVECPKCHEWVDCNLSICPNCGTMLKEKEDIKKPDTHSHDDKIQPVNASAKSISQKIISHIVKFVLTVIFVFAVCIVIQYVEDKVKEKKQAKISLENLEKERSSAELAKYEYEVKNSIVLHQISVSEPDNDGNITSFFDVENVSSKTIKYVIISGCYVDTFKKQAYDNKSNQKDYTWQLVGPIQSKERQEFKFKNDIQNSSVKNIAFKEIKIEYTDGSCLTINDNDHYKQVCKWLND